MNFVKPKKLSPERYKSLIDSICAQAHMENMDTDPEDRGDISDVIADILRQRFRDDEDAVLRLYNTMRGEDTFKYHPWRHTYGYIYRADEDFFDEYYAGCCPSEIVGDIINEKYEEEEFVAVGQEVNSSYSFYFGDDLVDFFNVDELAESIRDKWKAMHEGEGDVRPTC